MRRNRERFKKAPVTQKAHICCRYRGVNIATMNQFTVNPKIPPFPLPFPDGSGTPQTKTYETLIREKVRTTRELLSEEDKLIMKNNVLNLESGKTYKIAGWNLPSEACVNGNGAVILCGTGPAFILEGSDNVKINDCYFVGNSFSESEEPCILTTNSSILLRSCSFKNLNSCIKLVDCNKKSLPVIIESCNFMHCGTCITQLGDESFCMIRDNSFDDCHVAALMAAGNYYCHNNNFSNCQSCLFRVKSSRSLGGSCFGSFVGNTCEMKRSSWPRIAILDNKDYNLQAVLYDDEEHAPPLICSNTFLGCCPSILNCKKNIDYAIVGCNLFNDPPFVVGDDCKETVNTCGCTMLNSSKRKREEDNEIE